jgi:ABC-type glycerol-3-phosphate transport system substrate-binding protein
MAAAGLLVNLNKYAKQYGWLNEFSPSTIGLNSSTSNGKDFGRGNLYSVSDSSTLVGYFYNKKLLASLGLTVPTTMAQFTNELAVAKKHGLIPMEQGNLLHTWDTFMVESMSTSTLSSWIFGNGGSVDTAGEVQAAKTLQSWMNAGYFQPGFISESQNGGTAAPSTRSFRGRACSMVRPTLLREENRRWLYGIRSALPTRDPERCCPSVRFSGKRIVLAPGVAFETCGKRG